MFKKLKAEKMQESEKNHQKNLLKMVVEESIWYFILKIWDGRHAAFWKDGIEISHCTAVSEHYMDDESGWPFAFISDDVEDVRNYVILGDLNMTYGANTTLQNLSCVSDSLDGLYKRKSGWITKKHKNSFNYFRAIKAMKYVNETKNETLKSECESEFFKFKKMIKS